MYLDVVVAVPPVPLPVAADVRYALAAEEDDDEGASPARNVV